MINTSQSPFDSYIEELEELLASEMIVYKLWNTTVAM